MSQVPCNGCTICCKKEIIALQPSDNPDVYRCTTALDPISGRIIVVLERKPNGDCIYLNDTGCSIHGRAPVICREFDCRKFYLSLGSRANRRRLLRRGDADRELFDAARARLDSLSAEEITAMQSWGPSQVVQLSDQRSRS